MSSTSRLCACAVSTISTSTPGVDERHRPRPRVVADTDRGADQQPAVAVLGGQRELLGLDEVLDGDQPGQLAVAVDDRQLLNLVAAQQT